MEEHKILSFRLKNKAMSLPNEINNFIYLLGVYIENFQDLNDFINKYYANADKFYKFLNLSNENEDFKKKFPKELFLINSINNSFQEYKNKKIDKSILDKQLFKNTLTYFNEN